MIQKYIDHSDTPYVGVPQDVANMVAFLASDASRYITGQSLRMDGGFSLHSPMTTDARAAGRTHALR